MLAVLWLLCFSFASDWYRRGDWFGVTLAVGVIVGLPTVCWIEGRPHGTDQ